MKTRRDAKLSDWLTQHDALYVANVTDKLNGNTFEIYSIPAKLSSMPRVIIIEFFKGDAGFEIFINPSNKTTDASLAWLDAELTH